MDNTKRNNIIIASTVAVCLAVCLFWATVYFVERVKAPSHESTDFLDETSTDESTEEAVLDPMEALSLCMAHVEESFSFSAVTKGYFDTQVLFFQYRSEMRSERYVSGEEVFCQDVGIGSLVRYSVQQYIQDGVYLVRSGKVHSFEDITWDETPHSLSHGAHETAFGSVPNGLSMYKLDSETVVSAKLRSSADGVYTFVYEVDPTASVSARAKQLSSFGALQSVPVFESVRLTIVMNADYFPLSVRYEEMYSIEIPFLGKTTCKADYTETFAFFDTPIQIPEKTFFGSFLTLDACDTCPVLSVGYQLLLSLFEDGVAYEMTLSDDDNKLNLQMSVDMATGSIYLSGDSYSFLYQKEKYFLSYQDIYVYSQASEVNRYLAPLLLQNTASIYQNGGQIQNSDISALFASAELINEDGKLYIRSKDPAQTFSVCIDPASMSVINAALELTVADSVIRVTFNKTDSYTSIPATDMYRDITESVSAVSFLTELLQHEQVRYLLSTEGELSYFADVILSVDRQLAFSAISCTDSIPLDLYYTEGVLSAVAADTTVSGDIYDFMSLISLLSQSDSVSAVENSETVLYRVDASPDVLTLYFSGQSDFSLTVSSTYLTVSFGDMTVRLTSCGKSSTSALSAPQTSNSLSANHLYTFLSGSVYPALLSAKTVGGKMVIQFGRENYPCEFLVAVSDDPVVQLSSEMLGQETKIVYDNHILYLYNDVLKGFLPVERLGVFLGRLYGLADLPIASYTTENAFRSINVCCDGETLRISYDGTDLILYKQYVQLQSDFVAVNISDIYGSFATTVIEHPSVDESADLDLLFRRLNDLREQTEFSFYGTVWNEIGSVEFSRLDIKVDSSLNIESVTADVELPNDVWTQIHLIYDENTIYFDAGDIKLYAIASRFFAPLKEVFMQPSLTRTDNDSGYDYGCIRSIEFFSDVLTIETIEMTIRLSWKDEQLSTVFVSGDSLRVDLTTCGYRQTVVPSLDGYADATLLGGLLAGIMMTEQAGSLDFDGEIDLHVLDMTLRGITAYGSLNFSDDTLLGYMCIKTPYLYNMNSENIPTRQGVNLLTSCEIQTELFFEGERIYLCRTITAYYGSDQPIKLVITEKRYQDFDSFIQSPANTLAFIFNLNFEYYQKTSARNVENVSVYTKGNPIKRVSYSEDIYTLEFEPNAVLPSADAILFTAYVGDRYVEGFGAELLISPFAIEASCEIFNHGNATQYDKSEQDFSTYLPLRG